MKPNVRLLIAAFVVLSVCAPSIADAQAFTPPQGIGSFTLAVQTVDNTGHRLSDGFFLAFGQSATASVLGELEYGFTDRLAATVGLPYVFAKYTGAMPPPSQLPVDECACWHSSFQDVFFGIRYRLGNDTWAVTPAFRYEGPSHDYAYQGEAVVGRNLQEAQVGVLIGSRLVRFVPKMSIQGAYTYAFVEKALDTVKTDRSNGFFEVGYPVKRSVFLRGVARRLGDGRPFPVSRRVEYTGTLRTARPAASNALLADGRRGRVFDRPDGLFRVRNQVRLGKRRPQRLRAYLRHHLVLRFIEITEASALALLNRTTRELFPGY